jgi:exopolyphosphatase/guanosine-5'-triphosphate,3'-diphosphate pyrophosphatase
MTDSGVVGLLDLGSNSVRLLVCKINPNQSYTILTRHKQMVRLGEGAFATGILAEAAIARTIEALRNMADMCRGYDVADTVAYATAAVRGAKNGAEFVERAARESGIRFAVISGLEEARLIHLGVSAGISVPYRAGLFVDIGGGSTEVVVGSGPKRLMMDSLRLGAVRAANAFPQIAGGPVSSDEYERVRAHVRNSSQRSIYAIRSLAPDIMVGSSGTIQNLAEIAARSGKTSASRGADGQSPAMKAAALSAVAKKLCSLSVDERRKIPGINPQRADIIIAGAAILQTLMEELDMEEITVSGRGLLEGMLQDYLTRGAYGYLDDSISTREQSVLQLARSCGFNERHARRVAALAEK